MADYSEYKPRTFEDSLEDLQAIRDVVVAYRTLAYNGEIKDTERGRSEYAYQRLRQDFETLIKLRDNRYK